MEQLDHFIDIVTKLIGVSFDRDRMTISYPKDKNSHVTAMINSDLIEVDDTSSSIGEIDVSTLEFYFYFDETDFKERVNRDFWDKPIYILSEMVMYKPDTYTVSALGKVVNDYFLIPNNHLYFQLLAFLKEHEHQEDSIFYFVDYFSWDVRTIVFTTLKKEGKLNIRFNASGLDLPHDIHLKENLERLKLAFQDANKNFPKFIKNELISELSKYHVKERMVKLLENFVGILNLAEQNFEIYLHDLSLENIKKDYIEHKNKYFNQSREILSKLTNQVIGLPITIAASVFSTYKVSDSISTLIIILFVFLLYSMYSIFLLKLQKDDIRDLKATFEKDYESLKGSTFFIKFKAELIDFEVARNQISNRFKHLLTGINIYYILFSASILAFIIYVLMQMLVSLCFIVVLGVFFAIVLMVVYFILFC